MPQMLTRLLVLLLLPVTGCAVFQPADTDKNDSAERYWQEMDPFPVFDDQGEKIAFPFLGGFNAPRPQFVDIDGDGDTDLFVQENTGDLKFFEYTDEERGFPLAWKSNKFQNLDIGEWYRFVDLDGDGDVDLLTEQPYSYIRYYKNEGTSRRPDFELAADSLRDVTGTPIFSDRQNIPNVVDIDNNGKPDLFIGRLDGTLTRYESVGRDENDIPRFQLVTERFEDIEIVKQFGSLHGANTMAFMDIDSDGDQDIFWGDFFEPSVLLLRNEGTPEEPDFKGEPRTFPQNNPVQTSGYNAPVLTDWADDGDADLFLGVLGGAYNASRTLGENFYFYEQQPGGDFDLQTKKFLNTIDVGSESIVTTGDLTGNGLTDLLVANKIDPGDRNSSIVYIFENRGTKNSPEFHQNGSLDLPDDYHYAPAMADLNGDGLQDLMLGKWRGELSYYQHMGDGFELIDDTLLELPRGSNATPELADLDSDGDIDLLVGQSGGGVAYFRNEGDANNPDFQLMEDAFPSVESRHRSVPALHDADGDGDLDLFLGSKVEGILFYRNVGDPQNPEFEQEPPPFSFRVTQFSSPHVVDLDGDGSVEFLSGNKEGGVIFYSR